MRNGALKNLRERKRKGFTLVELLIVIIIIGILAGAMLLVAGSGTDKATATKITSDLRSLKSACLMYYADKNSWPPTTGFHTAITPFMDRAVSSDFSYIATTSADFIGYSNTTILTPGVKAKLADMAGSAGLLANTDGTTGSYTNGATVYMRVR